MSTLQQRIAEFLIPRGKSVDFDARRPPADMEDQADGDGPYIARWDTVALGDPPQTTDGFTAHELHRINS